MPTSITYHLANSEATYAEGRQLVQEYVDSLAIDLSFQQVAQELADLRQQYAAPGGGLLLVYVDGAAAGCVGVRALTGSTAELKRMYVRPAHRGLRLGTALLERALTLAKSLGYRSIRLDTLADMTQAQQLYQAAGFVPIPAYRFNPTPGVVYLEKYL